MWSRESWSFVVVDRGAARTAGDQVAHKKDAQAQAMAVSMGE